MLQIRLYFARNKEPFGAPQIRPSARSARVGTGKRTDVRPTYELWSLHAHGCDLRKEFDTFLRKLLAPPRTHEDACVPRCWLGVHGSRAMHLSSSLLVC